MIAEVIRRSSSDHARLRRVVTCQDFQLSTQRRSLQRVEHCLNRGKLQSLSMKYKIVLLAAQRNEVEI